MPRFPNHHNAGPIERRRWKVECSVVSEMRKFTDLVGRQPTPRELGSMIRRVPYVALYLLIEEMTPKDPEWDWYSVANVLKRAWEACGQRRGGRKIRTIDLAYELGINREVIRDWKRRYPIEADEW